METTPQAPPEGLLIEQARKEMMPTLSRREAARRAGIDEAWWRHIVRGYKVLKGEAKPVSRPAGTVAQMADVVGVTPEQLREAGRGDAANALERHRRESAPSDAVNLTVVSDDELIDELGRRLRDRAGADDGMPPLRLAARRVDPGDRSTFGGDD